MHRLADTYSRSIGPSGARPSPPRENGVRPEPLRCMSRRRPCGIDDLAEQHGAAVAESRRELAELVAGVGLRHRRRAGGHGRAREHGDALGAAQRLGVEPELAGQLLVERDELG